MAIPADGEVGAKGDLGRTLRTAYRNLPFAPVRGDFLTLVELLTQAVGSLLEGEAPVISI